MGRGLAVYVGFCVQSLFEVQSMNSAAGLAFDKRG